MEFPMLARRSLKIMITKILMVLFLGAALGGVVRPSANNDDCYLEVRNNGAGGLSFQCANQNCADCTVNHDWGASTVWCDCGDYVPNNMCHALASVKVPYSAECTTLTCANDCVDPGLPAVGVWGAVCICPGAL